MTEQRVDPYPDPPQTRIKMVTETYEYHLPFNYANITVARQYQKGREFHGVEMNPVNSVAQDDRHLPPDTITIVETDPIVRVAVIGSACVPPGYVSLEAEPTEDFYSPVDVPGVAAVRYRVNNLWGMHLRCDNWLSIADGCVRDEDGREYPDIPQARKDIVPGLAKYRTKGHWRENPLAGMSSATFEIPASRKVVISGGSEVCAWTNDNFPDDVHYSFRIIRVTVTTPKQ